MTAPLSPSSTPAASACAAARRPGRLGRHLLLGGAAAAIAAALLAWPAVQLAPMGRPAAPTAHAATAGAATTAAPLMVAQVAPAPPAPPPRQAQFGQTAASADVRLVANWALSTGDNQGRGVVVIDKKEARVYAFDREGVLKGATPALLGSAVGDHTVPGVGNKPIAEVLPSERTTPAGRFIAEPGTNASGEDIVWVDYDAAVSMHRVRPLVKAERRLERLASPTASDNRISYGCINLPVAFFENVLSPLVHSAGAVVYILPETQPVTAFFGAPSPAASVAAAPGRGHV